MTVDPKLTPVQEECVRLLDSVLDLAVQGGMISVGIVIVTEPGQFRISAAGNDLDGLCAGAARMQGEILKAISKQDKPKKPKLVIMK
jgi:hypothetical protein